MRTIFFRFLLVAVVLTVPSTFAKRPMLIDGWRPPQLVISQSTELPVELQSVRIRGDISGRLALTEVEMTFYNPNRRILEGELQFPLLDGQSVASFAMELNGALREAVPVDKARGQAVFEEVIRQRIDPALLEATQGNNLKLRVYPIPAAGTKRVVIRITEALSERKNGYLYRLPVEYADKLAAFSMTLKIAGSGKQPASDSNLFSALKFTREGDVFHTEISRKDFAGRGRLDLEIPAAPGPQAYIQNVEGKHYFYADMPLTARDAPRELPKSVGIVWDSSGSGAARDHNREFALLDLYFKKMRNGEVRLTRVRDTVEAVQTFRITDGDWRALREALANTVYDGASNLGAFMPEEAVREYLIFSDGLANFSDRPFPTVRVPLYAISAATSADATFLRTIAHRSGGRFIDLTANTAAEAADKLLNRSARVTRMEASGATQLVLASPYPEQGRLAVAGRLSEATTTLRLTIQYPDGKTTTQDIPLRADRVNSELAAAQWARLRVAELEGEYEFNRAEIRRLGQQFRLVTRETSLIVLDRIEDYVRHEIAPPAELRAEYERLLSNATLQRSNDRKSHLDQVIRRFEEKLSWWNRDFPKDKPKSEDAKLKIGGAGRQDIAEVTAGVVSRPQTVPAPSGRARSGRDGERRREQTTSEATETYRAATAQPVEVPAPTDASRAPRSPALERDNGIQKIEVTGSSIRRVEVETAAPITVQTSEELAKKSGGWASKKASSGDLRQQSTPTIQLQKWRPDAPYAARLRNAAAADRYRIYLDERPSFPKSTAFYLDVADLFFEKKQTDLGVRILSNLAEMDLENRHILRILGYRLVQAGKPGLAIPIFKKVLALSPEEPQSYRDLGLAYAADKQTQKAVDTLYEVVIRPWHGRFPEIELITLAELNAIIATAPGKLDVSAINPRLLKNMPLDLRVIMTWDADNTDIDLWVTDPNGEKAFYGHRLTYQGGRMSLDFTGGYGPEEFSLKRAKPGKYKIEANYYGDRRQNITGPTTLQMKLVTKFGLPAQREEIITLRLKDRAESVFVGEFEVKGEGN